MSAKPPAPTVRPIADRCPLSVPATGALAALVGRPRHDPSVRADAATLSFRVQFRPPGWWKPDRRVYAGAVNLVADAKTVLAAYVCRPMLPEERALLAAHVPLIAGVAKKTQGAFYFTPDVYQDFMLAGVTAAINYDPAREATFATYVHKCVLLTGMRVKDRIVKEAIHKPRALDPVSLVMLPAAVDEGAEPADLPLSLTQVRQQYFKFLTPRTADIIVAVLGLDGDRLTLREIGDRYGLSRERIRQLFNRGLHKLRRRMAEIDPASYGGSLPQKGRLDSPVLVPSR